MRGYYKTLTATKPQKIQTEDGETLDFSKIWDTLVTLQRSDESTLEPLLQKIASKNEEDIFTLWLATQKVAHQQLIVRRWTARRNRKVDQTTRQLISPTFN